MMIKNNGLSVACCLALGLLAGMPGFALAQDRSAQAPPATVAYLNTETGEVTLDQPIGWDSIPLSNETLQGLRRDSGDLEVKVGVNGSSTVDLEGRFQHVLVGSFGPDGKVVVRDAGSSVGAKEVAKFLQAEEAAKAGGQ